MVRWACSLWEWVQRWQPSQGGWRPDRRIAVKTLPMHPGCALCRDRIIGTLIRSGPYAEVGGALFSAAVTSWGSTGGRFGLGVGRGRLVGPALCYRVRHLAISLCPEKVCSWNVGVGIGWDGVPLLLNSKNCGSEAESRVFSILWLMYSSWLVLYDFLASAYQLDPHRFFIRYRSSRRWVIRSGGSLCIGLVWEEGIIENTDLVRGQVASGRWGWGCS